METDETKYIAVMGTDNGPLAVISCNIHEGVHLISLDTRKAAYFDTAREAAQAAAAHIEKWPFKYLEAIRAIKPSLAGHSLRLGAQVFPPEERLT